MSELDDQMHRQALAAQKFTRKFFVVELDFSPASLEELDGQFKAVGYALRGGASPENLAQLLELWGAYLGETLRLASGAEWSDSGTNDAGRWTVRRGATSVAPHRVIAERLAGSPTPHLRTFFDESLAALLQV